MTTETSDPKFRIEKATDPNQLLAIRVREEVCDDPEITDLAARVFVRLLDLALNPHLNNNTRGRIVVSQLKLASLLNCSTRSIRRSTDELEAANYLWVSYVPRPNTKPITCYHISKFRPKRQPEQEMADDGLWGNCRRRYDAGFTDSEAGTGKQAGGACGHKRPMGGALVDRFGKPISSHLLEKSHASGHNWPGSAAKSGRSHRTELASASGQNWPLSRTEMASASGQKWPLPAARIGRCEGSEMADYVESQVGVSVNLESETGGERTPHPQDGQIEAFKREVIDMYPSRRDGLLKTLKQKLSTAKSDAAKHDWRIRIRFVEEIMIGGPVKDEAPPSIKPLPRKAPLPHKPLDPEFVAKCKREAGL